MKKKITITEEDIPLEPTPCIKDKCVYRQEVGMCSEPRVNRGNSDAVCHKSRPRTVLKWLDMLEIVEAMKI